MCSRPVFLKQHSNVDLEQGELLFGYGGVTLGLKVVHVGSESCWWRREVMGIGQGGFLLGY